MKFKVNGFEKFNPRSDQKSSSWFRLDNDWMQDSNVFSWDNDKKIVWIYLVGIYSAKSKRGYGEILPDIACVICKVLKPRLMEIIEELRKSQVIELIEKCHAHEHVRTLYYHSGNESAPYERTNERTNGANTNVPKKNNLPRQIVKQLFDQAFNTSTYDSMSNDEYWNIFASIDPVPSVDVVKESLRLASQLWNSKDEAAFWTSEKQTFGMYLKHSNKFIQSASEKLRFAEAAKLDEQRAQAEMENA